MPSATGVVIPSCTRPVKTAVSIPDALFEAADALARERRVSRSALYAEALATLLALAGDGDVTQQLDALYADASEPVDPIVAVANSKLAAEPW